MGYENMYDLYNRIKEQCDRKNVSVSGMCLALGMSKSTMSDLKSGKKKTLSAKTMTKIADYLEVSVDDLLGREKEKPDFDEEAELREYLEILRTRPESRILLSTVKGATKEEVEANVRVIEALRGVKKSEETAD